MERKLTQRLQDVAKFSNHHFSVSSLVVELQALQEVVDVSDILVLLDLAEDGEELIDLQFLLVCKISVSKEGL